MTLNDNMAVRQVIGCLMYNPLLFLEYTDIYSTDFESKVARACFAAIYNLYGQGATKLSVIEVENEILKNQGLGASLYKTEGGVEFLKACYEFAELSNFELYYKRLKKYSLLRELKKNHYDISNYYKDDKDLVGLEELELQENFDNDSIEDILNNVEKKYNEIRNDFLNGGHSKGDPAEGIFQLIDDLQSTPDVGPILEGDIFNTIVRGARIGKYYLKSASTSAGKTRTAVFDACRLAFPVRYSYDKSTFIRELTLEWKPVEPRKILFIVTEMDKEELQTIMLAYLSGVNEDHILRGKYDLGELARVKFAAKIIEKYRNYFIIEEISDPNLNNVEATIKKYATIDDVKFVFFDYLHGTASMLNQFARNQLREDQILMLMSNQLKQLAKDYNLFIFSATQVNASGMAIDDYGFKNETSIRASKAIVDKADAAYIMTSVSDKMWTSLVGNFRQGMREGKVDDRYIEDFNYRPTHVLDIYKNRRGRFKNVRIWTQLNLGNGYRHDCFMTNADNRIIELPNDSVYSNNEQIIDWRGEDV